MKKLIFTLVLCFSLVTIFSSPVFAESNNNLETNSKVEQKYNEKQLDKKLEKLGFPEDLISTMEVEQKQEIIDSKPVKFGGMEKKDFYIDENGELQEINPDGMISIMSTIPVADLSLYNSKVDFGIQNGRATYRIYANWEWHTMTDFAYVDKIALSYNDQFQTRVSTNGAYKCVSYEYNYWTGARASTNYCFNRPSEISYAGAGWNFDKKYGCYRNKGYAQMDIESKDNTNPTGTLIVLSKLYHKTGFDGSLGVNIGYISININSGSGYDEAAAQAPWYY